MEIFKLWTIAGFVFLFIELAFPTLFFLNLAVGAFFAAVFAYYFADHFTGQTIAFVIVSVISLGVVRPFFLKKRNNHKGEETSIEGRYIGEEAQVIKKIGEEGTDGVGKIKIYGEIWDAKSEAGEAIEPFEMVKIVRNESLVMFVKKGEK